MNRKELKEFLAEVERSLKAAKIGVDEFDEIFARYETFEDNPSKREKEFQDLKTHLKKLIKIRDQIKQFHNSSEVRDKEPLAQGRRLIETKMEHFKEIEQAFKSTAFSKSGGSWRKADEKVDPEEQARMEVRDWVDEALRKVREQKELAEADMEGLSSKKGGKKSKEEKEKEREIQERIKNMTFHVKNLELVLRGLDNGVLNADDVNQLKDDIEYAVSSNTEPGYEHNDTLYSSLDLENTLGVLGKEVVVDVSVEDAAAKERAAKARKKLEQEKADLERANKESEERRIKQEQLLKQQQERQRLIQEREEQAKKRREQQSTTNNNNTSPEDTPRTSPKSTPRSSNLTQEHDHISSKVTEVAIDDDVIPHHQRGFSLGESSTGSTTTSFLTAATGGITSIPVTSSSVPSLNSAVASAASVSIPPPPFPSIFSNNHQGTSSVPPQQQPPSLPPPSSQQQQPSFIPGTNEPMFSAILGGTATAPHNRANTAIPQQVVVVAPSSPVKSNKTTTIPSSIVTSPSSTTTTDSFSSTMTNVSQIMERMMQGKERLSRPTLLSLKAKTDGLVSELDGALGTQPPSSLLATRFFNVAQQMLWHLQSFVDSLDPETSAFMDHACPEQMGGGSITDMCPICVLRGISVRPLSSRLVASLRPALTTPCDSDKATTAAVGLIELLNVLHAAFMSAGGNVHVNGSSSAHDTSACPCIVHRHFATTSLEGVHCPSCVMMLRGNSAHAWLEKNFPLHMANAELFISTARRFDVIPTSPRTSSYMRHVAATNIEMYQTAIKLSFGEGLRATLAELPNRTCPLCGKAADLTCERFVTKMPSVYTIGVTWPTTQPSMELRKIVLESISELLDVAQVEGNVKLVDSASTAPLISEGMFATLRGMLCFKTGAELDFHTFFKVANLGWFSCDSISKQRRVGKTWRDAAQACLEEGLQPACIFYDVVEDHDVVIDPIRDQDAFWGVKPGLRAL